MTQLTAERLDGANGLLLSPHIDHLFDEGYITFSPSQQLVIVPEVRQASRCVGNRRRRRVGEFSREQNAYLDYHRVNVFKRAIARGSASRRHRFQNVASCLSLPASNAVKPALKPSPRTAQRNDRFLMSAGVKRNSSLNLLLEGLQQALKTTITVDRTTKSSDRLRTKFGRIQ